MKIPPTAPIGSLIAYEFLWSSQSNTREDGAKVYPTAVIIVRTDIGPRPLVYALGISHKPPLPDERAMEVPPKLARHLGLDDRQMWIYTNQLNVFTWPGPDLRPAEWLTSRVDARGGCVIGALPTDWFEKVKLHLKESFMLKKVRPVKRSQ